MERITKKNLYKNLKSKTYSRIKPSKVHGVGVVAVKNIPKGVNPFLGAHQNKYFSFTKKEIAVLDRPIREMVEDFYVAEEGKFSVPGCGLNGNDISYYVNHSKKPNLRTSDKGETYHTLRRIKVGEELTTDYDTYDERE